MFYSTIIPIANLRKILPGEELKKVVLERSGNGYGALYGNAWFDDCLYREGSMGPLGNEEIIKFWEGKGLIPTEERNGKVFWKDLCLVAFPDSEPTMPCDWIEIFDPDNHNYYIGLKGAPKNVLVKEARKIEEWNFNGRE